MDFFSFCGVSLNRETHIRRLYTFLKTLCSFLVCLINFLIFLYFFYFILALFCPIHYSVSYSYFFIFFSCYLNSYYLSFIYYSYHTHIIIRITLPINIRYFMTCKRHYFFCNMEEQIFNPYQSIYFLVPIYIELLP